MRPTENKSGTNAPQYRVIVADEDPTVQRAIEWLLRRTCRVVSMAATDAELVEAATALQPDVVIGDVMMPAFFGSEAIHRSGAGPFAMVLISDEPRALRQWIEQGARCVVHTMDLDSDLETAVEAAANGDVFISRRAIGPPPDQSQTH